MQIDQKAIKKTCIDKKLVIKDMKEKYSKLAEMLPITLTLLGLPF